MKISLPAAACIAGLAILAFAAQAQTPPPHAAPSTDPATVAAGHYVLDGHHTSIAARINHMGFSTVTVNFPKSEGSFDYDPAHPETSKLDVTTYVTALSSGFGMRDGHLKDAGFFNAVAFPTIHFSADHLARVDVTHATVDGQLTLLGITKPVTLNVTFVGGGTGMMGDTRAGFSATAVLHRSDFGMTAFLPGVGDEVDLQIDSEFAKAK